MNLLLDTHVLLWAAADSPRLGTAQRTLLAEASGRFVSAASAYEIAMKTSRGRLPGGGQVLAGWDRLLQGLRVTELPLTVGHMARAGAMDWQHRDPFDRVLVAQAQLEAMSLFTDDAMIRGHDDVRTRWV